MYNLDEMKSTLWEGPIAPLPFLLSSSPRRFSYSVRTGSTQKFAKASVALSKDMINESVHHMTAMMNVELYSIQDESKASLRFSFWNTEQMRYLSGVGPNDPVPGGLAGRDWIALSNERPWGYTEPIFYIICHELGHWFGLKHNNDTEDLMHPWAGAPPSARNAIDLQRRWGKPTKIFYPYGRLWAARKEKELREEHDGVLIPRMKEYQKIRDEAAEKRKVAVANGDFSEAEKQKQEILKYNEKIQITIKLIHNLIPKWVASAKLYREENLEFKSVPMAHFNDKA